MFKRAFFLLLRGLCYGGLLLLLAAALALTVANADCTTMHEGAIHCRTPMAQGLAEFGMGVLLVTAFTGVPLLLAMGGVHFLYRDLRAYRRRRRG